MCGLIGFAGKTPEQFNRHKFNILGIANEERGTHSCGVAVDFERYIGVGPNEKKFTDFITNSFYNQPVKYPVVIGHTRYATNGTHTKQNAHPFLFENEEHKVIGAHNGVIKNVDELAEEFNVEVGNKIDSQVLLEILSKGNSEVLEKYIGAAAILVTSSKEPNTLWVFRGESKDYKYSQKTTEERPLFFYQETENSMYISSIEDSLISIVDKEEDKLEIKEFNTNILYKIVDGAIESRFRIDRKSCTQKLPVNYNNTKNTKNTSTTSNHNTSSSQGSSTNSRVRNLPAVNEEEYKVNNIHYDKVTFIDSKTEYYFEKLRYKRNGHNATGIFILFKGIGLYKLCEEVSEANKLLKDFILKDKTNNSDLSFGDITNTKLYYIYDGVMLRTETDYIACCTHLSGYNSAKINYMSLSEMSVYPVISDEKISKHVIKSKRNQQIVYDKNLYTGILEAIGSSCQYDIKYGNLITKTINSEIFTEENSLDPFNDADWNSNDDSDDDNNFDDTVNSLVNPDNLDSIESIISLANEYNMLIEESKEQLSTNKLESSVKNIFFEFCEETENRFKPIKNSIKELEEEMKSTTNN